jgi:hypothetical protein
MDTRLNLWVNKAFGIVALIIRIGVHWYVVAKKGNYLDGLDIK